MQKPEIPFNESDRQAALDRYKILDTLPEQVYDELTQLASDICGTPIALISLIDNNRQWFKSIVGIEATETPREISFCGHAVAAKATLNVPDASQDPRFADNPLVVGDPNIRFYTGIPLITEDDFALGTLCVIDLQPRNLTDLQIRQLEALSRLVVSQFELRLKENTVKARTNELQQAIADLQQENQQRLKTEMSLRESRQLFESLAAAAPVGIFRTDAEGKCIYVNERWLQVSGLTLAESLDFGWINGIHPSDRELVSTEWEAAIAENRPFSLEYRFQNKSGQITWGYGQAVAERDQSGEIIGYVGTVTDVSDRKQAEEEAQQRLDILEAARDIISSIDSTGKITYFNRAGREQLGIAEDEDVTQTQISDYHSPEMADFIHQEAIPHCVQQGFWSGETLFQRRDGSEFPVLQMVVSHQQKDGAISHFSTIARDISERKQAESALQQLNLELEAKVKERTQALWQVNSLHQAIQDGADYALISTDLNGVIQTFNKAAERMLGYSASEVVGQYTPEIIHDPQEVIARAAIVSLELGQNIPIGFEVFAAKPRLGIASEDEWTYIRKDGSRFPVLLSATALRDANQQIIGFLGIAQDISDRKLSEEKLRKSDMHLKTAQRIGKLGSWEFDPYTDQIIWSDEVFRIFGRDPAMGTPSFDELQEQIHPDDRAHHQQVVQTAIANSQSYDLEVRFYRYDGSSGCFIARGEPVVNATGQLTQLIGTVLDISDRKQKEQQLKQQLTAIEAAIDGIAILKDDCYIYLNSSHVNLFGYDRPEDLLGKNWRMLYAPEELQRIQHEVFSALGKYRHWEGEAIAIRKDGTTFVEGLSLTLTEDNLLICVCRDVSARKEAERQLQNLSDRLALAAKSSAMGIFDWDVVHNILTWDDRMYELYGIASNQFSSAYEAWSNSLHPDDRQASELAIQQALAGEKDFAQEFRVIHPDGTIRFIQAYAIVQRNERGEPQHMIGANFDVSDRKQAEVTIQQTAAQLEASNRELEAFAYSVSHDLRSPLRAIDGFSNALIEDYGDRFDDEARDYFDRIRNNIRRMGMLIDDLLRLSRVSRSEMQYGDVNLSAMFQEQIEELQAINPERQVKVAIAPNIIVSADRTLMQVVISNLVQNAWKFTSHHDSALIEFGVLQQEDHLTYFVRDDGAGFDMAFANMLFGVFQRLHNTNEFPGTGIGLATVQRAIHRHGGRVWAEGVVEQGATIYFTLPNTSIKKGV